jgi:hypothetical protein
MDDRPVNARPTPAQAAARKAEIAQRYAKRGGRLSKPAQIKSLRRAQVLRLLKDRHGPTLPDDVGGRAALQLLFELGLDGVRASKLAPWATGDELDRLIQAANDNWRFWARDDQRHGTIAARLGERLTVTPQEWKNLGLRHIAPNVPAHEIDQLRRDQRRERDRLRKRRKRAEGVTTPRSSVPDTAPPAPPPSGPPDPWDLPDGRAQALACVPLAGGAWWTVRALADFAIGHGLLVFNGLDRRAAERAIIRAVRELERLGMVETKIEVGPRKLPVLSARRLGVPAEDDPLCDLTYDQEAVED